MYVEIPDLIVSIIFGGPIGFLLACLFFGYVRRDEHKMELFKQGWIPDTHGLIEIFQYKDRQNIKRNLRKQGLKTKISDDLWYHVEIAGMNKRMHKLLKEISLQIKYYEGECGDCKSDKELKSISKKIDGLFDEIDESVKNAKEMDVEYRGQGK